MYNHVYKKYFSFINFLGYAIILISNYGFYSLPMDSRKISWILSSSIGGFLVIYKNSKTNELKPRTIYYFLDTTIYLGITFILKNIPTSAFNIVFTFISIFVAIYIGIYYVLINTDKITFIGEEKINS